MPTGIDLVIEDHRRVDELFAAFAGTGDGAYVGQIFDVLAMHDDAEQAVLYPLAVAVITDAPLLERAQLAHSEVKMLIEHAKFQEGAALVEAIGALRAVVEAHVAEEEGTLLPALQAACTPAQLEELGARWLQAKQRVG